MIRKFVSREFISQFIVYDDAGKFLLDDTFSFSCFLLIEGRADVA